MKLRKREANGGKFSRGYPHAERTHMYRHMHAHAHPHAGPSTHEPIKDGVQVQNSVRGGHKRGLPGPSKSKSSWDYNILEKLDIQISNRGWVSSCAEAAEVLAGAWAGVSVKTKDNPVEKREGDQVGWGKGGKERGRGWQKAKREFRAPRALRVRSDQDAGRKQTSESSRDDRRANNAQDGAETKGWQGEEP
eukprot:6186154-Pleurochrysis_carterae.AAC.1